MGWKVEAESRFYIDNKKEKRNESWKRRYPSRCCEDRRGIDFVHHEANRDAEKSRKARVGLLAIPGINRPIRSASSRFFIRLKLSLFRRASVGWVNFSFDFARLVYNFNCFILYFDVLNCYSLCCITVTYNCICIV